MGGDTGDFNEMFVFLIIQDDFKKLIKLVEN